MREVWLGKRGERLSMKEEGNGGGSDLGSDLDLDPDPGKFYGSGSGKMMQNHKEKIFLLSYLIWNKKH